ncbi:conserved hypothetical protein [Frankia canadensis]|uniref:Effector-associated domain-containing protein n=1 Tax=Frankia canadensis TaxID=1836972 RepID=A0A2I2KKD3_9ACTN|nr:effector-associated domain EAD1-containing protein [Frankia canadensis]SNQ46104.1 conserved hypothetical protein [Frankia canadensis]SOU53394.1 conserved hypothetical protein [Frankia canadensis]
MTQRLSEAEIEALARSYSTRTRAIQLLERAGLSRDRAPVFVDSARDFWFEVAFVVEAGAMIDGRARILATAARDYPGNPAFSAARASPRHGQHTGPEFGPGQPVDLPRHVSLFSLDARGYSKNDLHGQGDWQDGLREIVAAARKNTGLVDHLVVLFQNSGDGCLCAIDGSVAKAILASDFVRELRIAQKAFNRYRPADSRLRLRMSLHQGEIVSKADGAAGDAVVVTTRLIDAPAVRQFLTDYPEADLVLAMSPAFFASTAAERLRDLDPEQFTEIPVSVSDKYEGVAWVTLPGHPGNPPVLSTPRAGGPVPAGTFGARRSGGDGPPPFPGRLA